MKIAGLRADRLSQRGRMSRGYQHLSLPLPQKGEKTTLALGIEFAGQVVKQQQRRFPKPPFKVKQLRGFEREKERALLTLGAMQF